MALAFELSFGADIERLQNPGIDGGNDIYRTVQIGVINPCFPCVRKAAFHSRLTIANHGDGKAHEDFFAFTQIVDRVSIAIELPEISSLNHGIPPVQNSQEVEIIPLCRYHFT